MIRFMLKSFPRRAGRAAFVMSAVLATAAPAYAQYDAVPTYAETPEDALSRNLRLLAQNPRNFQALVAAGRAALATGDTQAAVGFFGRAEEASPSSWQPQAGKAAAMVAMGDPQGALPYFARAQALGAAQLLIAVDRGLAFDLIGDQARAQSDYRAALVGAEADEARRRLAVSLAISRDISGAAATIEPLLQRRDPEAVRTNAFILALAGDREGARRTIDAFMPGAGTRFEPFFKMLPVLRPAEKAAAVHLGIFPNDAAQRFAQAEPIPSSPVVSIGNVAPQRQAALAQKQARQEKKPPVKVADAPRRAVREAPEPSTYRASIRPSLDPSRFASTRRPKSETAGGSSEDSADSDPESRPVGRLADIAQLLSETAEPETSSETLVQVAEAQPQEPSSAIDTPPVSRPKIETARSKPIVSRPKVETSRPTADPKAARLAAEKKAKAEAEKKAKAEATKLGVAGTTWVQLAGGANQDRLGSEFKKLAARAGSLLKSRSGYVTDGKDYFRLLVGPFSSPGEAQAFVTKLDKAGVDSFRWTRNPAQIRIEKLKS
jgi:Flp pilus assembly protein TadD